MIPYTELTNALSRYRARVHGGADVTASDSMPLLSGDEGDDNTAMAAGGERSVNIGMDDILSEETRS